MNHQQQYNWHREDSSRGHWANSADLDQTSQNAMSDQDLHCLLTESSKNVGNTEKVQGCEVDSYRV